MFLLIQYSSFDFDSLPMHTCHQGKKSKVWFVHCSIETDLSCIHIQFIKLLVHQSQGFYSTFRRQTHVLVSRKFRSIVNNHNKWLTSTLGSI